MTTASNEKTRMRVDGMDCASCATKIETALQRIEGVSEVKVSVPAGTVVVQHAATSVDALRGRVEGLGYKVVAIDQGDRSGSSSATDGRSSDASKPPSTNAATIRKRWWQTAKARMTIGVGIALLAAYGLGKVVPSIEKWAFLAAMLVGLVPIARRAFAAAVAGTPFSIEMLMTIAAIGAVFIGATEEAAAVVLLFLIGELLEGVAASRARASIQDLTKLVPETARLEQDGSVREVPAASLGVDAIIQIRPGDRIPADGVIIAGESSIDEAPVTGESTPVRKGPDATVYAGTINADGVLRVRVTAAAADNTIARVIRLVEEAQESKAPTERFIDRFSTYYTPAVVIVAALVTVIPPLMLGGIWSEWIYKGLAILLIGCPCALVISTPAAIAASLSAGARRGLLLKGGAVLEEIGRVQVVCFDKTGTLTAGRPQLTDVATFGPPEAEIIRMAAALEAGSSHPLATAIMAEAAKRSVDVPPALESKAIGGKGVSGAVEQHQVFLGSPQAARALAPFTQQETDLITAFNDDGKTASVLLIDGVVAGVIAMRDEPRPDAQNGLQLLRDAGIDALMLTGDNQRTAAAVGRTLDVPVRAELLPQDKQRIVAELKASGKKVAKVGDGINDAPALAAADVGIAMGGGTDVALETADAAVLHGRVADVAAMVHLSRRTMANIKQNIGVALGLKALFLVTTVAGVTGLWPAILADTGATVLVTMNALRLLAVPSPRG